MHTKDNYRG